VVRGATLDVPDLVNDLALDPTGRRIAVATSGSILTVHDLNTGSVTSLDDHLSSNGAITWPDDTTLISAGYDGQVLVWNPSAARRPPERLYGGRRGRAARRCGKHAGAHNKGGNRAVRDARTLEMYANYEGHRTQGRYDPATTRIDITSGPLAGLVLPMAHDALQHRRDVSRLGPMRELDQVAYLRSRSTRAWSPWRTSWRLRASGQPASSRRISPNSRPPARCVGAPSAGRDLNGSQLLSWSTDHDKHKERER
jgi:hypothetical protein